MNKRDALRETMVSRPAKTARKQAKSSRANASQSVPPFKPKQTSKRLCDAVCPQCCKAFARNRRDQVYCTPNCRRIACEKRKEALIEAVHNLLLWRGISLQQVADAVETAFKQLQAAVRALGYRYDEFGKHWVQGVQP